MSTEGQQYAKLREKYRKQSLRELQRQYLGLTASIEKANREIAQLDAMIAGLIDHRPEDFMLKVEELREQQERLKASIKAGTAIYEVLKETIKEKEAKILPPDH